MFENSYNKNTKKKWKEAFQLNYNNKGKKEKQKY